MVKPIFIIGVPYNGANEVPRLQKELEARFLDYYVLVYLHNNQELEFKTFYEKDFNDVKFEELKAICSNALQL